jgi:hypothetical protein
MRLFLPSIFSAVAKAPGSLKLYPIVSIPPPGSRSSTIAAFTSNPNYLLISVRHSNQHNYQTARNKALTGVKS